MHEFPLLKYQVIVDRDTLSISFGKNDIRNARCLLRYLLDGKPRELSLISSPSAHTTENGNVTLTFEVADSSVRAQTVFTAKPGDASLRMDCQVEPEKQAASVRVMEMVLLSVDVKNTFLASAMPDDVLFRGEAPDGWTNAGNKRLNLPSDLLEFRTDTAYISGGYFERRSGAGIFAYHLLPHQWIDLIHNDHGRLDVVQKVDVPLRSTDVIKSDPLLINLSEPVTEALASMASHQKSRRRPAEVAQHIGWNNFDYYKENFSHESIVADMKAIRSHAWMGDRVRYIILDGAWEELCGDWEPNPRKFPKGMAAIAREISDAGFVPGIWIAPFFADRNSKILIDHPEYAVQYDGRPYSYYKEIGCDPPWGDRCYLDPTHPVVQQFIFDQMRKLYNWGYRYFKTDFLVDAFRPLLDVMDRGYETLDPKAFKYHDPDIGLARAHRNCMNTIRAAIGEESFWLGCGSFIPSGAELMDASRICADIAIYWPQVRHNAQSAIFSSHLHGNAYLIDPDFAVFRGIETMDVTQLDIPIDGKKPFDQKDTNSGPPLNEAESRQWAAATILCGGMVTLSDKIAAMNDRGLAIIRTVLDYAGGNAARPIDFAERIPSLWLKRDPGRTMLGVFNWDHDQTQTVKLKKSPALPLPQSGQAREIWSGKNVSLNETTLTLAPRTVQTFVWNE